LHPIMGTVICDPRWVHRRNQIIYELLENVASEQRQLKKIEEAYARLQPDLKADPLLLEVQGKFFGWHGIEHSVFDLQLKYTEMKDWVRQRCAHLRNYLADVEVFVTTSSEQSDWTTVQVLGSSAVRVHCSQSTPETNSDPTDPGLLYPGLSKELFTFYSRPHEQGVRLGYAEFAPMTYLVKALPEELSFTNAVTGQALKAQHGPAPAELNTDVRTIHPELFSRPQRGEVVLGPGEITLTENLVIGETQSLTILPATRIFLDANIGIYACGPVRVLGEPRKPVELLPAGDQPWAAFGVAGLAANGSRFQHMRVQGGSLGTHRNVRFKGMFNVYHCGEVTLEHCEFSANQISDDAVNINACRVLITDCVFHDPNADGLDLDFCEGIIRNCHTRNCGNDGFDLMSCKLTITDSEFLGSVDKGISIGEGSFIHLTNCELRNCETGIEVKDASRVLVRDTRFLMNQFAVHAYQKKWLYGRGGAVLLQRCRLEASRTADVWIEKRSSLDLLDTSFPTVAEEVERIRTIEQLGSEWNIDQPL
jgi:hypothetical protein